MRQVRFTAEGQAYIIVLSSRCVSDAAIASFCLFQSCKRVCHKQPSQSRVLNTCRRKRQTLKNQNVIEIEVSV